MGAKLLFPIDEINRLVEEGYTIAEITTYFKTSRPTISKFLKENNIKTKKNKQLERISLLDEELICKLYSNEKLSINDLCKKFDVSDSVIKRILHDNKVYIRTNSEAHRQFDLNVDYFKNIDTINKAYLLGFICADGFVTPRNEIGITIQSKDRDLLTFFAKEIETNKPIVEDADKKYSSLILYSDIMAKDLNNLGIIPNKSLVLDISQIIVNAKLNKEQEQAFLLGYFDGDGGVYKTYSPYVQYSCSVTGTFETCSYYKKYCNDIGFITKRHDDDKNNYTYQIGGRNKVKEGLSKFYNIINTNQLDFYYQRKYILYSEL